MQYKNIKTDKYNLNIIKTNKFKTIEAIVQFRRKVNKNDITKRRLLATILSASSKKYPTKRLLEMETEELYSLAVYYDTNILGNYDVIEFHISFLNEKYTEIGMNKKSLLFFLDFILNPNVKNNEFDDFSFDLSKKLIRNDIKTFSDYPNSYSLKRMLEAFSKTNPISYRNVGYLKDLSKINSKNLYEYYLDVMENDIVDISIIGDIDIKKTETFFKENFSRIGVNKEPDSHYNKLISKKEINLKEKMDINQSQLVMGFTCDIDDNFVRQYVLKIYSYILGGGADSLLFKMVREKNSLCYSIYSTYNILSDILIVRAGIDASKYDKVVSLVKECTNKMKNGEFNDEELDKAKTIFKSSCLNCLDSPDSIMYSYLSKRYMDSDLIDEKIKKIDLVTKDMVVDLANKIELKITYMLESENEEDI